MEFTGEPLISGQPPPASLEKLREEGTERLLGGFPPNYIHSDRKWLDPRNAHPQSSQSPIARQGEGTAWQRWSSPHQKTARARQALPPEHLLRTQNPAWGHMCLDCQSVELQSPLETGREEVLGECGWSSAQGREKDQLGPELAPQRSQPLVFHWGLSKQMWREEVTTGRECK